MARSHRFLVRFNVGTGTFDRTSREIINSLFSEIKKVLDVKIRQTKGFSTRLSLEGGTSFDTTMRNFTKSINDKVRMRFYRNPVEWNSLGPQARQIREFRLDPEELRQKIYQNWYITGSTGLAENMGVMEPPAFSFNPKPLQPEVRSNYPALLQTGKLSRSITLKYFIKNERVNLGNDRWIHRHYRTITFMQRPVPYAKIQFYGGVTYIWSLYKVLGTEKYKDKLTGETKTRNKYLRLSIPSEYVPSILGNESKLEVAGFHLEKIPIRVSPRNPMFFDKGDLETFDLLLERLGHQVRADFSKLPDEDFKLYGNIQENVIKPEAPTMIGEEDVF